MKKVNRVVKQTEIGKNQPAITAGLDLGDRYSRYCLLNEEAAEGNFFFHLEQFSSGCTHVTQVRCHPCISE